MRVRRDRVDLLFERHPLGRDLDHEVRVAHRGFEVGGGLDTVEDRVGVVDLSAVGEFAEAPLDVLVARVDELVLDVAHHHVVARYRDHLGDAVTHVARAEHRHPIDVADFHT